MHHLVGYSDHFLEIALPVACCHWPVLDERAAPQLVTAAPKLAVVLRSFLFSNFRGTQPAVPAATAGEDDHYNYGLFHIPSFTESSRALVFAAFTDLSHVGVKGNGSKLRFGEEGKLLKVGPGGRAR